MSINSNGNDIAVIGELNVDLLASGLKAEPRLGQEMLASDFEITLGSASAIFACGIARLGRGVTFIGRVGRDQFGQFCIDALSKHGISTDQITVNAGSKTGVTIVLSTPQDRAMVTYLGAIAELSAKDVTLDALNGHRHLHLTSYYLQRALQSDFPRLMAAAKDRGLTTSFDPNSDPEQRRNEKVFEVLACTDILFLNEPEVKLLTGQNDARSACVDLSQFCPLVVVKLGARGSIAYRGGEFAEADGFSIAAVDTTGAGDSFAAGFVHAFLNGWDMKECLRVGNACGAMSATRTGGIGGQPDRAELESFLNRSAASAAD